MLAEVASLVPHTHVEICVIVFALALCYALWGGGALMRCAGGGLPAVPQYTNSLFPTKWDQLYTALFILYFAYSSMPAEKVAEESGEPLSMAGAVVFIFAQFLIYAPMLVRFCLLQPHYRPRFSLFRGLFLVAGFLFIVYLCSAVAEASGFNDWLIRLTSCPEDQDVVQTIKESNDRVEVFAMAISAVFQAPVCEECAFRGFLYNILKVHSGKWCAAVGSALFFSAIHASLPQLLPIFLLGLIQCWAYEKAKSLWLPICIHTAFNALGILAILHTS